MRPMWTGALSFGLINIPVKLYSAAREQSIKLRMLEKGTLCPIGYVRVCKETGKEVPYEKIVKGYEFEKGDFVVLEDEDFERANVEKTKTIDIVEFVDEKEIGTEYYDKPYYLEPEKRAQKAYALLCESLKRSKKVGIARMVLRTKEHIAELKPHGNMLMLHQLRFQNEIRPAEDLSIPENQTYSKAEINMALMLIEQLTSHFKPGDFSDTYTQELFRVIGEKKKGKKPKKKGKEPEYTRMQDIMEALKKSLEKERIRG